MSSYSDYLKGMKEKDLAFFFGEVNHTSNKYFTFDRVKDDDNVVIITNNIKVIKGNYVLVVDNNKVVYLQPWQVREVRNYNNDIYAYAVKLCRKYFKPYTFNFEFEDMAFQREETFDDMLEVARQQNEVNMAIACGWGR